jgi:hypothetical protein
MRHRRRGANLVSKERKEEKKNSTKVDSVEMLNKAVVCPKTRRKKKKDSFVGRRWRSNQGGSAIT